MAFLNCGFPQVQWTDEKGASYLITDMGSPGKAEFIVAHQAFVTNYHGPVIDAIVLSAVTRELTKEAKRWADFFAWELQPEHAKPHLLLIATYVYAS